MIAHFLSMRDAVALGVGLPAVLAVVLGGLVAFLVTLGVTPLVIRLARARAWIARSSADRWHSTPTALMGGIGIFIGVAAAVIVFVDLRSLLPVAAAATIMFVAGFVDDRVGLHPVFKLIIQLCAAGLLIAAGWSFELGAGRVVSVALTVFWILGITNAVNLVDNMDGLSSGIAAIAAVSLTAMALIAGAGGVALAGAAVAGAAAAFLRYNFKPARIFMGDCGSLFLGFAVAALAVMVQAELSIRGIPAVVMTALVLGVPIIDTTLVTLARALHNRPVSKGGLDHTSHRLVRSGLSEKQAVLLLYGLAALFAVLAPVFYASDIRLRVSLVIFALIGSVVFAGQIGSMNVYGDAPVQNGRRRIVSVVLTLPRELLGSAWKPFLAVIADVMIVTGAFVLSHHLRFETALTHTQEQFLLLSLPVLIGVRIPVFALFGFYRAIWRHAGAFDVARVVAAVTVTSIISYIGLGILHGFSSVSQGVLVIDWMAVTLGILLSRFGFRGLRSYLSAVSSVGRPVAVYGADDAGAETVRLLRSNAHELRPVAIVDTRREMKGQYLQGVRVIGGFDALAELCGSGGVSEVILPENSLSEEDREAVEKACRDAGVRFRSVGEATGHGG